MHPTPSRLALHALRTLTRSNLTTITTTRALTISSRPHPRTTLFPWSSQPQSLALPRRQPFSSTPATNTTINQVRTQGRKPKKARRTGSPAVRGRGELKGVCLKVGITKPKKPNSGQRKTAKIRLSTGKVISAYIPGEGHNVQQHSVVMVRGGRSQDCPGVGYHLVRGALDLGGVASRIRSRSKYGTKKPKTT